MTEQPAAKGKASAGRGSSGAMKMVVGLGNPGPQYEGTRHNVGFAVVHRLARQVSAPPARMKGPALVSEAKDAGVTIVLAQPLTFMNRSGRAVSFLLDAYGIPADDMLVVYDDVHLPLGQLRLRGKGSAGGHNGIKSIIAALGHEGFPRLRIGIAPSQPLPEGALADFVLSPFKAGERLAVEEAVEMAAAACRVWAVEGLEAAMQRFNGWRPGL